MGAEPRCGCYGVVLDGVPEGARLLHAPGDDWPVVRVRRSTERPDVTETLIAEQWAQLEMHGGGRVVLDRASLTAELWFPDHPDDETLVHPYLFPTAATVSRWLGREAFHAGCFVADGGAWAVLAEKGGGKSSTLGHLVTQGVSLVTDDLLVLDGFDALGGPSCVDLRPDAAARLGVGEDLGFVGQRDRWRYVTPPVPMRTPLRGWIFPTWGECIDLRPVPAGERLHRLLAALALPIGPVDPSGFLELAALPAWELRRPRSWDSLAPGVDLLLRSLPG